MKTHPISIAKRTRLFGLGCTLLVASSTVACGARAQQLSQACHPALALPVQMVFNAIGPQTNLSFYADIGHCIDIDNVSVTEAGGGLGSC